MVARLKDVNWNYLLNPVMAGLDAKARASEALGRSVAGGLDALGQGFKDKRREAENARRFERDQELQEARFALDVLAEQRRDRQAAETTMLDEGEALAGLATQEAAQTGQVSPQTAAGLKATTDFFGGAEATIQRVLARGECGTPGRPP